MSSKKYATPLRLEIKPSRSLFLLLLVLHLAALVLVYILDFNLLLISVISVFVLVSAYFSIVKIALQKSLNVIVKLVWDANNEWLLETKSGEILDAELMRDSYVSPLMTILIFRCKSRIANQKVILLKDNINEDDFRRLRVRLKVGKPIEVE